MSASLASAANSPDPGKTILQDLRSFSTTGTLLHIAAHPDDENTALITYFARGRGYRTAYLSLTRGDGGQNEIGPEFDEKLGVARTHELLVARELDGGRQFFTRAIDFGYSKTVEETLAFWDRKEVLGDVVRVIRQFRPDVIVTRFSPTSGPTHGHHTASAVLALEAFKLAGDPKAYPEQLTQGLTVWQPKRILWNGFGGGRGGGAVSGPTVRVDIGGNDPVTGESFSAIASRSRARHITQFGYPSGSGGGRGGSGGGANEQSFVLLAGEPAEKDVFDGVDVTWSRFPGGTEIGRVVGQVIAEFKADNPAAIVPALLQIRKRLRALGAKGTRAPPHFVSRPANSPPLPPNDPVLDDKLDQLDRIICACLGLEVQTIASTAEVVPGETLNLELRASVRADVVPVLTVSVTTSQMMWEAAGRIEPGRPYVQKHEEPVDLKTPLTHPYWLRKDPAAGLATVADPLMIGRAKNPPSIEVIYGFRVGDEDISIRDEPVHIMHDAKGERRRRVDVIPPVSLRFGVEVALFKPGSTHEVAVDLLAARAGASGTVKLDLPTGWKVTPAAQPFKLANVGEKSRVTFSVTSPSSPSLGRVTAYAEVGGQRYANDRVEINYAHIPLQLLQPPARARLANFDFAIKGKHIGYLPGAGDNVAECIEQMGYTVTRLKGADLTAENLKRFDAVVIGVRAFNERDDLAANLPGLFAYVEQGGTVIAQYNRPNGLRAQTLGPYPLSIQGSAPALRVTDEKAPVAVLDPEHSAVNRPNKISDADFGGWVQERGAYFPSTWDKASYTSIFAMSDPGEPPLNSSVLIAKHGQGYYVYTGIAFFRQLPAGVPGAYRLFANLVSLGK